MCQAANLPLCCLEMPPHRPGRDDAIQRKEQFFKQRHWTFIVGLEIIVLATITKTYNPPILQPSTPQSGSPLAKIGACLCNSWHCFISSCLLCNVQFFFFFLYRMFMGEFVLVHVLPVFLCVDTLCAHACVCA